MIAGIMSDSHDDMQMIVQAINLFNERKVGHVVHAGDIISPFTFEKFRDLKAPLTAIFGNNDGDKVLLKEKSNGTIHNQPHIFALENIKTVIVHEPTSVESLAKSGEFHLVIYGHTHRADNRKVGDTLVLNPGKTARLHKGESTVALLDTETLTAQIITL